MKKQKFGTVDYLKKLAQRASDAYLAIENGEDITEEQEDFIKMQYLVYAEEQKLEED